MCNIPIIEVPFDMVLDLGRRGLDCVSDGRVGLSDIRAKCARLYLQTLNDMAIAEIVSVGIRFGSNNGVIIRLHNITTGDFIDVRQSSIETRRITERSLLVIACCGVYLFYGGVYFGLIGIHSLTSKDEKTYRLKDI